MKPSVRFGYTLLCLIQSIGLVLGDGTMVFAAAGASSDTETRVGGFERTVYGEARPNTDVDSRLKELEVSLFGKAKSGDTNERISAIAKALSPASGNLLLPAIAPQLDTSATNARADSTPQPAPYNDALEVRADKAKEQLRQAMDLYSKGDMQHAEQAFKGVLAIDNRNADAYYNLGVIAESRNDLQSAESNYRAALNINPGDNDLRNAVTSVQNKLDQSITAAKQAREQQTAAVKQADDERQKGTLKQYTADASTAFKAGNYDKAISDLQVVSRQAPQDSDVQYALGQAYRGKGDIFDARSSLTRAISLSPSNQMYKTALNELDRQIAQDGQSQNQPGSAGLPAAAPDFRSGVATSGSSGFGGSTGSAAYGNGPGSSGYGTASTASTGQLVGFSQDDSNSAPTGQLTPFANTGDSGNRYPGYASSSRGFGFGAGGMGSGYGSSGGSRLQRAAVTGLTGAAMGAVMSSMFSRPGMRGQSMMRGAMMGGAMGLLTGGLFSH
jgi:tetratricopeptide (TPR) repeat protein